MSSVAHGGIGGTIGKIGVVMVNGEQKDYRYTKCTSQPSEDIAVLVEMLFFLHQ